ncbi:Trigger factor [Thalassoporum mexicanum PCC 7367]|uniref:trigger factor n=1 Tax=Thalassoporum mexicanum TaxID=3457544 RepID=UPI00029FCA53|nr:trigger factor [Pseudanabaena sp. PCC 7367]AFY69274.1 Trigger factor [Pseudanabaena sp. PCC 7367]
MKVLSQEKIPESRVCFEIEIEGEKSQAAYDRNLKSLSKSVRVPGFRPGKAPQKMVLRHVGAENLKATILQELLEKALTDVLKDKEEELQVIGSFDLLSSADELLDQLEYGEPLVFKAAIDVQPAPELDKYSGFELKVEKIEPDLSQVDETLHQYQLRQSTLVPVEDRGAELGDVITIDFTVADEDGNELPEMGAEDMPMEMDESDFIPELIQKLVGIKLDETREITVTVPEGYLDDEYEGKPATFTITLKDLKARELPELDDDFAQAISDRETMAELREFLEQRIIDEAEETTKANLEGAILEQLVENLTIELPHSLVSREVDYMLQQQAMYMQRNAQGDDQMLKKVFGQKEFVAEMRRLNEPEAINRLQRTMALAEVARLEKITVPEEELKTKIDELRQNLGGQQVDDQTLREVIEDEMVTEHVLEWLKENSQIEYVPEGSLEPDPAALDADLDSESEEEAQPVEVEVVEAEAE